MDTNVNKKVFVFSYLMGICIGIAIVLMISFFLCHINPDIDSGWLRGLWHGSNFVPNLILSIFDGRILKAPIHSTAYSVFWWMCCIVSVIVWILMVFGWIIQFRKKMSEYKRPVKKAKLSTDEFADAFDKIFNKDNRGTYADVMPEGYGEFGLEITNPIPVHTIVGNQLYLERLRTANGVKVTYERIGSMHSPNIPSIIDGYRIFAHGIQIATLYICPYNKKNSEKAPKGFKLV